MGGLYPGNYRLKKYNKFTVYWKNTICLGYLLKWCEFIQTVIKIDVYLSPANLELQEQKKKKIKENGRILDLVQLNKLKYLRNWRKYPKLGQF